MPSMHIDFSSAIDNARLIAARAAASRQNSAAVPLTSSRWCALPSGGRGETRGRTAAPAVNIKAAAGGRSAHAH
ncbi:MAG: hypothetical protein HYX71_08030 [Opitutae bacterium]|nr:hypothetical protein [Opitutae bacterium]